MGASETNIAEALRAFAKAAGMAVEALIGKLDEETRIHVAEALARGWGAFVVLHRIDGRRL